MIHKSENLKDKQIEINLHTLELINENIRLYQDNIKLNHEVKRLKRRLEEQEDIDLARLEMLMGIEDSDSVVILMVKNSGEFIN